MGWFLGPAPHGVWRAPSWAWPTPHGALACVSPHGVVPTPRGVEVGPLMGLVRVRVRHVCAFSGESHLCLS